MLAKQKQLAASAPVRPSLNAIEPFASLNARWGEMTRREDELMTELRPLVGQIRKLGGYLERGGVPVRPAEGPNDYRPGLREKIADLVPFRQPEPAPLTDIDRLKAKAAEIERRIERHHRGEKAPLAGAVPGARRGLCQGLRRCVVMLTTSAPANSLADVSPDRRLSWTA